MNFFSIRDLQNLTGIKAHTLRIWEQRHSILSPRRKQGNHRLYDSDDLKQILRVAFLYHKGYKISRIASLSEEELSRLALDLRPEQENYDVFIQQLTEATIDLDTRRFETTLDGLLLQTDFEKAVLEVLFPLLRRIGHLWLAGNVMPAQEHFASAIIIRKMLVAIDQLERPSPTGGRRVALFTPYGEMHEIPLLFMQYMLRKHGVPYIYLGSNLKTEVLRSFCGQAEAQHSAQPVTQLYFHLITNLIGCDLSEYLHRLSELFPRKEIIVSGSRNGIYFSRGIPGNVQLLKGADALMAFVRGAGNGRSTP